MKTQNSFTRQHAQRGVALVIVLSMLLLLSALLVAFMSSVSTERLSARAAAATFEAKQAYESAVNLVISQIREATKNDDGSVGWASQPGAIRTFKSNDTDLNIYKLYSSDNMIMEQKTYKPADPLESGIDPSSPMDEKPGFVNLNAPLIVPVEGDKEGKVRAVYPIVDPMAVMDYSGGAVGKDPATQGRGSINGFYCTKLETKNNGLKDSLGRRVRELPLRVKWLYQLKDGSIAAADGDGKIARAEKDNPPIARFAFWTDDETSKLNLNTAAENTYWDPPFASTAQECGRVDSSGEIIASSLSSTLALAASQPAVSEHQRYPGHPATTSLSPAIRWLFQPGLQSNGEPPDPRDKQYKEALYRLLPRYQGGYATSGSGTKNSYIIFFDPYSGIKRPLTQGDPRMTKRDRLFASIDEFWFRPDRSPLTSNGIYSVFLPESTQPTQPSPVAATFQDMKEDKYTKTPAATIDRLRLFLTTVSRSPDLNLQGKPRVSVWPMPELTPERPDARSAYDDVANFCSTIAKKSYSFQRYKPWSPTYDLLQANGGRNVELMRYLQNMTNSAPPGSKTGTSFAAKYGADREQILTMIFDYVRSTNLVDTANKKGNIKIAGKSSYYLSYTPGYDDLDEGDPAKYTRDVKPFQGSGQVVPILRFEGGATYRGMGRFVTLSEMGLVFFRDRNPITSPDTTDIPDEPPVEGFDTEMQTQKAPENIQKRRKEIPIRCMLLPEMFSVSPGYPALSESYAYTITEEEPFSFIKDEGGSVDFSIARGDGNYVEVDAWRSVEGRFFQPTRGFGNQLQYDAGTSRTSFQKSFKTLLGEQQNGISNPLNEGDYSKYPFYSKRMYARAKPGGGQNTFVEQTSFKFKGGKLRVDFYSLENEDAQSPKWHAKATPTILQTVHIQFPKTEITVPMPHKNGTITSEVLNQGMPSALYATPNADPGAAGRFETQFSNFTIRSMEINGICSADIRHVMGTFDVPDTYYSPARSAQAYSTPTLQQVQNYRASWGRAYGLSHGVDYGYIVKGQARSLPGGVPDKPSKVPASLVNGIPSPGGAPIGDYDRGMSKQTDGPFINKTDEGNIRMKLDDDFAGGGAIPYYRGAGGYDEVGANFFSPNRIISSPVMFGSLPSGIKAGRPWETLLFCPPIAAHRGAESPADHFLLDLFNMPVVEPYAISEPLSTAGRVNLNHRFAPWGYIKSSGKTYIERTTALHGVLKDMKIMAIPTATPDMAHQESPLSGGNRTTTKQFRQDVDIYQTIELSINGFLSNPQQSKFGYFKSATEICEIDLLTKRNIGSTGEPYTPMTTPGALARGAFWGANQQTGDNGRERPYSMIYPRLCTKSNTYTVHVWAQGIAKNPATKGDDWNKFDEDRDRVIGEYRGSTTLERYLDPNDPAIEDYDATKSNSKGLDPFYRFRILNQRRFVAQ